MLGKALYQIDHFWRKVSLIILSKALYQIKKGKMVDLIMRLTLKDHLGIISSLPTLYNKNITSLLTFQHNFHQNIIQTQQIPQHSIPQQYFQYNQIRQYPYSNQSHVIYPQYQIPNHNVQINCPDNLPTVSEQIDNTNEHNTDQEPFFVNLGRISKTSLFLNGFKYTLTVEKENDAGETNLEDIDKIHKNESLENLSTLILMILERKNPQNL